MNYQQSSSSGHQPLLQGGDPHYRAYSPQVEFLQPAPELHQVPSAYQAPPGQYQQYPQSPMPQQQQMAYQQLPSPMQQVPYSTPGPTQPYAIPTQPTNDSENFHLPQDAQPVHHQPSFQHQQMMPAQPGPYQQQYPPQQAHQHLISPQQAYAPQHQHQHLHRQPQPQPQPLLPQQPYQQAPQNPAQNSATPATNPPGLPQTQEWQSGLMECGPCNLCAIGTFLPCVLFGRTSERMRDPTLETFDSSNPDCLIWCAIQWVSGCGWVYSMMKRTEIRERYGIKGSGTSDCCASYWCTCCAIIQQEKEVMAHTSGMTAKGPITQGYQPQKESMIMPNVLVQPVPASPKALVPSSPQLLPSPSPPPQGAAAPPTRPPTAGLTASETR